MEVQAQAVIVKRAQPINKRKRAPAAANKRELQAKAAAAPKPSKHMAPNDQVDWWDDKLSAARAQHRTQTIELNMQIKMQRRQLAAAQKREHDALLAGLIAARSAAIVAEGIDGEDMYICDLCKRVQRYTGEKGKWGRIDDCFRIPCGRCNKVYCYDCACDGKHPNQCEGCVDNDLGDFCCCGRGDCDEHRDRSLDDY
eukprot:COSAG01_NODE_6824_length_3482_cov_5.154597_3_plen_198_part_00